MVMTNKHAIVKVKGQLVQKQWKRRTDGLTDTTDLYVPHNAVVIRPQ